MKKRTRGAVLACVLIGTTTLSACGGGSGNGLDSGQSAAKPATQNTISTQPVDHTCYISDPNNPTGCIADGQVLARSVVNYGDDTRIKSVIAKAKSGQPITIAAIGGSVTQGAWCTQPQYCYVNRVFGWWQSTFPQSNMTLINAGIGQTDSAFGASRVQKDVLDHNPDFVIVDFDVNDQWNSSSTASYRNLVEQILGAPSHPAVVMLAVMDRTGHNAQDWHIPVQQEFNLPYVSEKNALLPEEQAGTLQATQITQDAVHPNDLGHQVLAELIAYRLQSAMH